MSRAIAALHLGLRLERAGFAACAGLVGAVALGTAASFEQVVGTTEAERLAAAQQLRQLAVYTSVLLPVPGRVETLAGFVQWRVFGGLPLFLAAWSLLAGVAATRGDEERGRLEQWLAAGVPRPWWLAVRAASFALVSAGVAALAGLATIVGAALGHGALAPWPLVGSCVALWALAFTCFGVAIVAAQFAPTRRGAMALAGALLGMLYLLNSVPRGAGAVPPSRWLSPFYWYDRSNPLAPGGRFDAPATLGLAATAALLAILAGTALARRDLGAPLLRPRPVAGAPVLTPSRNPVWRATPAATLYEGRFALLGWAGVAAAGATALTGLARPIVEVLLASPVTRGGARLLAGGDPYRTLLGLFLFGTLQLLIALYAVAEAGRWAADDASGRLEMQLSAPVSRRRIVLERALALALALVAIAAAGTAAGVLGARRGGLTLGVGEAAVAGAALLPFGLSFGGVGAILAGARPRLAVPVLGAFAAGSFFFLDFGLIFGWPAWLVRLSPFGLYGIPLVEGVAQPGLAALVAISLAGFGAATLAQQHRDIGR